MSPEQKLKWMVLNLAARWSGEQPPVVTAETVDAQYDALVAADGHWDARNEVRCSGTRTSLVRNIDYRIARHYEHEEVAAKMPDGSWVGWTYWHGGGKHGQPDAIDWMPEAYAVEHRSEPRTIMVDVFSLPATASAS